MKLPKSSPLSLKTLRNDCNHCVRNVKIDQAIIKWKLITVADTLTPKDAKQLGATGRN